MKGTTCSLWGFKEGKPVHLIRLINKSGAYVELTDLGATVVAIVVADRSGKLEHIALGFPELNSYIEDTCYLGATVGPFANRIAGATFTLDGQLIILEANDGDNTNHSGTMGLHSRVFNFSINEDAVVFSIALTDMEDLFPGNRNLQISYSWNSQNELSITYKLTTDKPTPVSITNHTYFNLSGSLRPVGEHHLNVAAEHYLEMDSKHLPTGRIISQEIVMDGDQLNNYVGDTCQDMQGFNRFFTLNNGRDINSAIAILQDPISGRTMEVFSDYPGILLYTGDFLHSKTKGHQGRTYRPFDGLCLESQYFPDTPNKPDFPNSIFTAENPYQHFIKFKFSTQR